MRAFAIALAAVLAAGCLHARGIGRPLDSSELDDPGWRAVRAVPYVHQHDHDDCGVAAAAMVLGYWKRAAPEAVPVPEGGLHATEVKTLLEDGGLRSFVIEGTFEDLEHELSAGRPVIVGTVEAIDRRHARSHYVVVVALDDARVAMMDPAVGLQQLPRAQFGREWAAAAHTAVVGLPPSSAATTPPSRTASAPR
jgi:ABC-type bacteriocin/lantibiotic exporter with double-glycine peptidase domain